jgi:hypothetical protein
LPLRLRIPRYTALHRALAALYRAYAELALAADDKPLFTRHALSLRRLLAERNQLFDRHSQYVPELISKLAAVEGAPHIHENGGDLIYLN